MAADFDWCQHSIRQRPMLKACSPQHAQLLAPSSIGYKLCKCKKHAQRYTHIYSGCCSHTSLLRTRGDLQLDGLINSTAMPHALLDQCALMILAAHTFDLPADVNTGNHPVIINAQRTSKLG